MKTIQIKFILLIAFLQLSVFAKAQYATDFHLTDMDNANLKEAVQVNITNLLTEINSAYVEKRLPDFSKISMAMEVQNSIRMLWENTPFRCAETEVIERCLNMNGTYQVRNIPLFLSQPDGSKDEYQEGVIGFDSQAKITDFHLAISTNLYTKVLVAGKEVADFRYRQLILDYVEQFRTD